MPTENIRNLDQLVLGTLLFASCLQAGLQSGQVAGPRNYWPNQVPSNGAVIFYDAQKQSVCHKLVKCYGNLQDKYSSVF